MAIFSIVKKTDYFSQQVRMTKATAQFKISNNIGKDGEFIPNKHIKSDLAFFCFFY